jgi:hypothetical protein
LEAHRHSIIAGYAAKTHKIVKHLCRTRNTSHFFELLPH